MDSANECFSGCGRYHITVIPRLTTDPANEFSANEDFFAVFWGHSTREVQSTLDTFFTSPIAKRQTQACY